ncbi:endonuclease v [Citrus sinensis]|nr:endonuclease v [Citrus sinensis]
MSFSKEDPSIACGCIVVLDLQTLQIVYEDYSLLRLQVPYVPGFLAFREAPVLLSLLDNMKKRANHFYPQVLMVDGNGLLHPRGFGLASHIGVLANLTTIGLHHVDGLTHSGVRQLLDAKENNNEDIIPLMGGSGSTWGVAMRSTPDTLKPIFISVGHCISLDTAVMIVKMTCKYRVPEPIRQADIRSRDYLQKHQSTCLLQRWQ